MDKDQTDRLNFSQIKYQYIAVICVNIVSFCQGYSLGWPSPSLPILQSDNSPLSTGPITTNETILLGALPQIGAVVGTVLFSVLSNYLSRINSIILLIFPNLFLWMILIASNSIDVILTGRLISGLTIGGLNVCIPLFVAEISDKRIRGSLGLALSISVTLGVLTVYCCGTFMDYDKVPYVIIGFPMMFLLAMTYLPDTPSTLLRKNKIELAKESLIFYYNGNQADKNGYDADSQLGALKILVDQRDEARKQCSFKLILSRQSLQGLVIGISLIGIVVLSGSFAFTVFASQVFRESNANFDPNLSAIIMALLQFLGVCVSSILIDTWGRRKLFGMSSALSGAALTIFGIFSYMHQRGFDMSSFFWVPVASLSFYIFINNAGMRPLPFVYIAEILPNDIRHIGSTICMFTLSILLSISIGSLPVLIEVFKLHTVMWMYSGICFIGVIFSIFVMQETKGKSLNAIK